VVAAELVRRGVPLAPLALVTTSYVLSARLIYFPVPYLRRLVMDGQFMLSALLLWLCVAWLLSRDGPVGGQD